MIFCKDFAIPLFLPNSKTQPDKKILMEVFRKTSDMRHTPLVYDQFEQALTKLAVEVKNKKIEELGKKLKELMKLKEE